MKLEELGRYVSVIANGLISASLFFVLIWWRVSVYLFVAGSVMLIAAWLMDATPFPSPFTVPE